MANPAADLKAELARRGISQTDLAERLNKSRQYINGVVNGRRTPPRHVAELMAFKTGIPLRIILREPEAVGG